MNMGLARKGTGKRGMEEKSLLEQNKSKVRGKDIQNKEEAVFNGLRGELVL